MLGCVEQCKGCDHVALLAFTCTKLEDYAAPAGFWRRGGCPYATHIVREKEDTGRVRVGQQKQKKGKK